MEKLTPQESALEFKSEQIRMEMWEETLMMLGDRPIQGAGLAGYQSVIKPYHQKEYVEIFLYPHNIFLTFWSELGIAGLILFIIILIKYFLLGAITSLKKNLTKEQNKFYYILSITLMATMTYLIAHGLVDVPYFKNDLAVMFWVFVGMLIVLARLKTQKINS